MLALALLAQAFVSPLAPRTLVPARAVALPTVRMAAVEDPLVAQGEQCLESGCSVDEVSALIAELNTRRVALQKELTWVLVTLGKLEALNKAQPAKERTELENVVRDSLRIFRATDDNYPELPFPTGYSMDPYKA